MAKVTRENINRVAKGLYIKDSLNSGVKQNPRNPPTEVAGFIRKLTR